NPRAVNTVKAGAAIPIKFSLGGNSGLDIFAAGSPASQLVDCNTEAPLNSIEATDTAGGSSLSYDSTTGQYIYVWKTEAAWSGTCRNLYLQFNDGAVRFAEFKFN